MGLGFVCCFAYLVYYLIIWANSGMLKLLICIYFNFRRYSFALRIVLLLVVAWMTLLLFNSALIVVPTSLGRALFNAIPLLPITHGIKCNGATTTEITFHYVFFLNSFGKC